MSKSGAVHSIRIRKATAHDLGFLEAMLHDAANWREPDGPEDEVAITDPRVAKYLEGWGRDGDFALVASDPAGTPMGAAWYRFFPTEDPGFGFVGEDVPEVTLAVERRYRGRGVGRALLESLIARAADRNVRALSLSVEIDNRAVALYEAAGFEKVGVVDNAWTMRRNLH